MPRSFPPALLLPALAVVILGSGCTTTVPGSAEATSGGSAAGAPASADAVAWVDQVCGSLLPFVRATSSAPNPQEAENAGELIGDISEYLGQAEEAAGTAIDGMAAAGPSPVAGGDEVVDQLTGTLSAARTSYQDVRSRINSVDVTDREALLREVPAAIGELQRVATMPNPAAGLDGSPELSEAGQQAANCQQLGREFGR